jgi:hypothetical protein
MQIRVYNISVGCYVMTYSLQQAACTTQFSAFPQLCSYAQAQYIWFGAEFSLQGNTVLCFRL